ncbi:MAG: Bcr/CflA family efflux MFS transporter [Pseudomonadota bacterium]
MSNQAKETLSAGRATLLLAGLISIRPFAIDAYLPAMGAMALEFGTTVHALERSMGSFFLGVALGNLLGAPVSDRIGRMRPTLCGIAIFVVASFAITRVGTDAQLTVWRFIQAFGGGVAVVNAAAIVRDLFDEVESARLFANIAVVMMIAPLVSPLIGAYLLEAFGWPAIFLFLGLYGILVGTLLAVLMPETRFLRRKPVASKGYQHVLASLWSNVLAFSLAFSSVSFFLYLADSSFIFLKFYGLSPTAFAWLFGAGVLMLAAAHRINHRLLVVFKPRRLLLYCIPIHSISAAFTLLYALLGASNMWLMYTLIMLTASLTQIITANGLAVYLALHPDHTGKANAIIGALRFGIGGIFGVALSVFHSNNLQTFGVLTFASSLMGLVLFTLCRTRSDIFSRSNTT